jgi:hypothetical protein
LLQVVDGSGAVQFPHSTARRSPPQRVQISIFVQSDSKIAVSNGHTTQPAKSGSFDTVNY